MGRRDWMNSDDAIGTKKIKSQDKNKTKTKYKHSKESQNKD
jgi:hypothetical protein